MVKKAVIPAAGFGTRLLPATKSQPKEMIPVVDKPVIQYVVEEAVASGITDILMVIGKGKRSIEEYFDRSFDLEQRLEEKGRTQELEAIKQISQLADIHFVWQKELKGLGDAVYYARHHVGNEPFVVLLGDTIVESPNGPVSKQLINAYEKYGKGVVALQEVEKSVVSRYGVIDGTEVESNVYRANDFIEKPSVESAPSNLAIGGRYLFTADIFKYLKNLPTGVNNEIQLTDAMRLQTKANGFYGLKYKGMRYDVGNKMDYLKTNIILALEREDLKDEFRDWLKEFSKNL